MSYKTLGFNHRPVEDAERVLVRADAPTDAAGLVDWSFDAWPTREPSDWSPAMRGHRPDDNVEFHVDLGCGKLPKARIGVDRYAAEGVDVVMSLDHPNLRLPFPDSGIESIVTHHALEHIVHFLPLMDECYRVLKPGGMLRAIVPLFPSWSAVSDPDHKRYFMAQDGGGCTFDSLCGTPTDCWLESFSVPYTKARFQRTDLDLSPEPEDGKFWAESCAREMRVTLRAVK